jgi:hypothetical protein
MSSKLSNDPICECNAPLSKHCKGNQQHTDPKEDSRMMAVKDRKGTFICHTRHCLAPLCSCVDFREKKT